MDNIFEQLLTLPNVAFCLMVWVLVWMQRKVLSLVWAKAEASRVYREFLLPLGPLGTGGIMAAIVSQFPYPEGIEGLWGRVMFGVLAGLASAHVYKMAKPFLPEAMQKMKIFAALPVPSKEPVKKTRKKKATRKK